MAASVKKKQYDIAYAKTHLKRVPLDLRLDKYNEIKEHAESHDESINGFIKRAIDETMARYTIGSSELTTGDLEAICAARKEYVNGETINHNTINWD